MEYNRKALLRISLIILTLVFCAGLPLAFAHAWTWQGVLSGTGDSIAAIIAKIPLLLVSIIGYILDIILWVLFKIIAGVLNKFFTPEFYQGLGGFASNPIVVMGWKSIVSVANAMFIIALLFIGVGTLFRVEKYNYKRTLIKLVVVALLTNFSLLFAGVILDFFHILMFSVFQNPLTNLNTALNNFLINIITNAPTQIWNLIKSVDFEKSVGLTANVLFGVVFIVLIIITLIAIAFFLVVRTVMLWVLLVLSPFAYVGLALPDTQGMAEKWWSSFLKYAIMGPLIFFFVWFSSRMLNQILAANPAPMSIAPATEPIADNGKGFFSPFSFQDLTVKSADAQLIPAIDPRFQNENTWIYLMFIIVLLWGSLIAAASCGAIGAGFFMGAFKGAALAIGGLSLFAGTKGALKGAGWLVGSRREKSADIKMGLAQQQLRHLDEGSDAYKKKQQEIEDLRKQKESGRLWHDRFNFAAALGPVSMFRAAQMRYKNLQSSQVAESNEALTRVGSLAKDYVWGNLGRKKETLALATLADRQDERNQHSEAMEGLEGTRQGLIGGQDALAERGNMLDDEINEKNVRLQNLMQEMSHGASPTQEWLKNKLEGEIQALEAEKNTIDQQIATNDTSIAGITGELRKGADLGDLDERFDQEFIEGARKRAGFFGDRWEEALHFDAVHEAKVSQKLKEFEHLRDEHALTQRFMISTDPAEKEAITLKLQSKADMDTLMKKSGYSSVQLGEFLKDHFPKRRGYLLGSRLQDIALQTNNWAQSQLITYDKKEGTMRLATQDERNKKIAVRITKQPLEKLIPNLSNENVRTEMPDGSWQALPWSSELYQMLGSDSGQRLAHKLKKEIYYRLKTTYEKHLGGEKDVRAKGWEKSVVSDKDKAALREFLMAYERGGGTKEGSKGKKKSTGTRQKGQQEQEIDEGNE